MFFHHICIQTNDYLASKKFYTQVLGFDVKEETKNFHSREYNTWLTGYKMEIELITPKENSVFSDFDKETCGVGHICFFVRDIKSFYEILKRKNVVFKKKNGEDMYEVFGTKLFKVIAPEGTIIEFRDKE